MQGKWSERHTKKTTVCALHWTGVHLMAIELSQAVSWDSEEQPAAEASHRLF